MKPRWYAICPITYESIMPEEKYSKKGLRQLSLSLKSLHDLPLSAEEQRMEAQRLAEKMSIQGVQPKLSARLNVKKQGFEICDVGGTYILKPQNSYYPELPENEDLTMRLASVVTEVPLHGLLYCSDGSFTYFIKRFDRISQGQKLPVEDFSQLAGLSRDTKYDFSMERIIPIIDRNCTFPAIEKVKLFTRVVFNYLVGNEDMHLKNFSLITREGKTEFSPAYDFLNTTIALRNTKEQIALPLNGKKNNLTRKDIVEYYGMNKLGLNMEIINEILNKISVAIPNWTTLIKKSFLSERGKQDYLAVLEQRLHTIQLYG